MKNCLIIALLLGINTFTGCTTAPKEATSGVIEGKFLSAGDFSPTPTQSNYQIILKQDNGCYVAHVTDWTYNYCCEERKANEKDFYIRLVKGSDGLYFIKERAVLNYDYGTPAVYEFPSDKKVISRKI